MAGLATPELFRKICDTLRKGVPFIALAAEANGVNRNTVAHWIMLGDQGDPRYADFATEVRQIRAEYLLKNLSELEQTDRDSRDASAQKAWILSRLDKAIFDPPKEVYEKAQRPERISPLPQDTEAPALQQALDILSQPATNKH